MKLSVVIPCYNEERTIRELLKAVSEVELDKEVVVVNDASTDQTSAILESCPELYSKLITHRVNKGKGAALRSGFAAVTGDLVVIQDADLEYDPREYGNLIQLILDGKADVVYGSRFQGGHSRRVLYYWHSLGNIALTTLSNMFTNLNLTDMETCYKVFRSEIVKQLDLQEPRFGVEPEITAKVAKMRGVRIYEVGISYDGRTYSEGKKIGWRDGFTAVWCILKYNLLG
ncbi:MAG: glycosyltransferase family 2 protein [Ferrimicrobium sp.]